MAQSRPAEPAVRAPYASAVRTRQASETRRAIVAAAGELFVAEGYSATTIDAVADRAGVGRKTVFSSVGGKAALLKLVWDWTLAGDDAPIPMAQRPAVRAMVAEQDPQRLVRMWVDMVLGVSLRANPVGGVIMAAADVDPEAGALLDTIRRESLAGATAFVTHLAEIGGLRTDLSIERAAEACWALINSLLLHLLVTTRSWSPAEYAEWLHRVVSATLLEPTRPGSGPAPRVRVAHQAGKQRYVATVDGRAAGTLTYERSKGLVVLMRTDVEPGSPECAVAGALVRRALDDVRASGRRRVHPLCHFAAWWIGRNPEYALLLPDSAAP